MFKFTSHAIERYVERVEPGITYRQAVKKLPQLADRATAKKQKTGSGQQQWVLDEPRCAFITKIVDDKRSKKKIHLVVTTLGPVELDAWQDEDQDPYAFEKELYLEYQASLKKRQDKAHALRATLQKEGAEAQEIMAERGFRFDPTGFLKEPKKEKLPKLNGKDWMQLIDRIGKENKAICRLESHRESIKGALDNKASALRIALLVIIELAENGGTMSQEALDGIKAIDPLFLKNSFLYDTRGENKRIIKRG